MKIVSIIPARMGSSRYPGKPLALLAGRPMVEHVYWRTAMCKAISEVYVATCDKEIFDAVKKFGGRAIMTSPAHERASDRVAEAAQGMDADIVVMVQGDEPMIRPEMIDVALGPMLSDDTVLVTNIASPIRTAEEFDDPNTIKVAIAENGDALYFSRQPIPSRQRLPFEKVAAFKQVCVIPFRAPFLQKYTHLPPTPLEIAESIDMLRALEHGYPVRLVRCDQVVQSVDTPGDLARVNALMEKDDLIPLYPNAR